MEMGDARFDISYMISYIYHNQNIYKMFLEWVLFLDTLGRWKRSKGEMKNLYPSLTWGGVIKRGLNTI